jgi:transglutaminase-like putative cysteine protease
MDGIPARYICGLMLGEGATHAWVEFYDGQTWWGLDPTNDCEAGDTYIVVNRGRDFGDCPMESGIFKGGAMQLQLTHVNVKVVE